MNKEVNQPSKCKVVICNIVGIDPKSSFREIVTVLFGILFLAVCMRSFVVEPFTIPSGSMYPGLMEGDHLFVWKPAFGFNKFSLPFGYKFNWFDGRFFGSNPTRGEVIVFTGVKDPSTYYIKRVIGLPGDKVGMKEGVIHVNGKPVELREKGKFVLHMDTMKEKGQAPQETTLYEETFPWENNKKPHDVIHALDLGDAHLDNTEEVTVPENGFFVMGDNRNYSGDSREDDGAIKFVPSDHLVGRALIIFYSKDFQTPIWQLWKLPFVTRYSRLLKLIN